MATGLRFGLSGGSTVDDRRLAWAGPVETAATASRAYASEAELHRRLDRAIGRALVDKDYAAALLAYPTMTVGADDRFEGAGQYAELQEIHTSSLQDFARQVQALFWPGRRGAGSTK